MRHTTATAPVALVCEVLDQVEERGLRPMNVVEDEDERPLTRARLAEPPEEPRELGRCWGRIRVERREHGSTLSALGRLLECLAQRPVRDALAVREASPPEGSRALRTRAQLGCEP